MAFDPLSAAFDFGGKILDKFFPDPTEKAAAKLKLLELQQSGELAQLAAETDLLKGQLAINQVEAANENIFISGWRPFIGWCCGLAFAYTFVIQPFVIFLAITLGSKFDYKTLPQLDWSLLGQVLLGMLGLGAMRTFEKVKGVR